MRTSRNLRRLPLLTAVSLILLTWACISPAQTTNAPKEEKAKEFTSAKNEQPTYTRTYQSKRKVEIEKPDWGDLLEEEKPQEEVVVVPQEETPPVESQPVVKTPVEEPQEIPQETPPVEEESVAEEPPPPPVEPTWEDDFANDMNGIKKRKEDRSDLVQDLVRLFPIADEIQLGEGVAARVLAGTPESDNLRLWEYVTYVGLSLVEVSSRNDLAYYFVVLDDPEEINAFAAPGGFIFITTGAIRLCQNEAELASILAHEIGHVAYRHGIRMLDLSKYRLMMKDMVQEMDEAFGNSEFYDLEKSMDPRYKKVEAELSQVADQCFDQILNPYSQDMELEADLESLLTLYQAGYNPIAAITLLQRLRERMGDTPAYEKALHSHPPTAERIEKLVQAVQENQIPNTGTLHEKRFQQQLEGMQ